MRRNLSFFVRTGIKVVVPLSGRGRHRWIGLLFPLECLASRLEGKYF